MESPRFSRRRRKASSLPDLRRVIAFRKASGLRIGLVAVVGDDRTGRNTLVRRFLDMHSGPFQFLERKKFTTREILVNLAQRPNSREREIVKLRVFIINLQQLDFQTIHEIMNNVKSAAIVFDVTSEMTLYTAIFCMVKIGTLCTTKPGCILVGTKIDLEERREIQAERGRAAATTCSARRYYECSALMNMNVDPVFDMLLNMAL